MLFIHPGSETIIRYIYCLLSATHAGNGFRNLLTCTNTYVLLLPIFLLLSQFCNANFGEDAWKIEKNCASEM